MSNPGLDFANYRISWATEEFSSEVCSDSEIDVIHAPKKTKSFGQDFFNYKCNFDDTELGWKKPKKLGASTPLITGLGPQKKPRKQSFSELDKENDQFDAIKVKADYDKSLAEAIATLGIILPTRRSSVSSNASKELVINENLWNPE
ncbi:hypothetical protein K7432_002789 [Basidiobolus ranarum]|uniref:Uncharacterized protein n=1 Tax=Basidiobolus ranarum TaxID=34480 RepID=A0ABR2X0Y4_9FUNG